MGGSFSLLVASPHVTRLPANRFLLSSCVFSSSSSLQLLSCVIFTSMSSSSVSSSGVDRTNDKINVFVSRQKNSHILGHVNCIGFRGSQSQWTKIKR